MPELPEAETIARALAHNLIGKIIRRVDVGIPSLRKPLDARELRRNVVGKKVTRVHRRGKAILAELSGDHAILLQLGMTGGCRICSATKPVEKHEHVVFGVSGGRSWRFNDARRFGMVESFRRDGVKPLPKYLESLGPEPLMDEFTDEYLFRGTRKRECAIKQLLLNQQFVAGIGNIYASEILFRAGVRPRRAAGRVTRKECRAIVSATRAVLRQAIAAGGTTTSDYRKVDGSEGKFKRKLRVYGKRDAPCVVCRTPIKRIVQGGRSSYYCPVCQK